jgi:hypothetical protein
MHHIFRLWMASPFLLLCLTLSSCGEVKKKYGRLDEPSTLLTLRRDQGEMSGLATLNGKIMVYLLRENDTYARSVALNDETHHRAVNIPSGFYRVYAVGWDGAPDPMSGNAKCAKANGGNPLLISGNQMTISLPMSQLECGFGTDGPFGPAGDHNGGSNFKTLKIYACDPSLVDDCLGPSLSGKSARVVLFEYERFLDNFDVSYVPSIKGQCRDFSNSNSEQFGNTFLPTGRLSAASVEFFQGASCNPLNLLRSYPLLLGLNDSPQGSTYLKTPDGSQIRLQFLKDF